jgi:hypothetical protein
MDPMTMMALAQMGGSLFNMFGNDNPADAGMDYMNQIRPILEKYLGPYHEAGMRQLPGLEGQYSNLTGDPGGFLNKIGGSYQQSPGFDFAMKQALQASNNAAAAGGMAGTPQHQFQNMEAATGLANRDYNQWLGNALGLYGRGLGGQEGLYNTGANASMNLGQDLASVLGGQAQLAYEGQNAMNQNRGRSIGSLLGGFGSLMGGGMGGFGNAFL